MARTRSRRPLRPIPPRVGAADAVVEHLDHEPVAAGTRRSARRGWRARAWRRWSAPRRRRSRRSPRVRAGAVRQVDVDRHRDRAARREGGDGGVQAAVGQHRRVDAAGEVAQLDERLLGLAVRLVDQARASAGSSVARARPSVMASATSRCCAPSCRSRSIRRRSASAAATMPARVSSSVSDADDQPLALARLEQQPRHRHLHGGDAAREPRRGVQRAGAERDVDDRADGRSRCRSRTARPRRRRASPTAGTSAARARRPSRGRRGTRRTSRRTAARRARNSSSSQEPRERIQRGRAASRRALARQLAGGELDPHHRGRRAGAPCGRARGRRRRRARSAARRAARRSASGRRPPASPAGR